jgi:enediyne biosynthesis protein E4
MHSRRVSLLGALVVAIPSLFAPGCDTPTTVNAPPDAGGDTGPALPPVVCKTPGPPAAPWFNNITARVLPQGGDPNSAPTATSVRAADLDGDGYPDLITTGGEGFPTRPATGTGGRRDVAGSRTRNLFMNRPDPSDPTGKARIFVDATEDSHLLDTRDGKGGYAFGVASLGDVDNDGNVDVVVGPSDPGDTTRTSDDPGGVMLNDGTAHFTLAPGGSDLDKVKGFASATCTLFDFNKDGLLDFLPGTFVYPPPNYKPPMLLEGTGDGKFNNVTKAFGIVSACTAPSNAAPTCSPMYGLTACDLDMDGDQDILFASYGREPNQVWRNDGDHFTEIGDAIGLAHDDRADFSDDQSYRCYCQNRPGTCVPQPPAPDPAICKGFGIKLCVGGFCTVNNAVCTTDATCPGDGRGWYPGYTDQPWDLGGNNYSLVCGDFDNDGDMDVMTSTIRHGDVGSASDPSELCINDAAPGSPLMKFRRPGGMATGIDRSAFEAGLYWNEGDLTAVMLDVDNDGLKDVYICSSDYPADHGWLFHQKPDHTFENATDVAKLSQSEPHGIAFFDFDKDGDLDVAMGTSTARVGGHATLFVYENTAGQDQNWLQVQLVGAGAGGTNRSAIGALVKVTAGGVTQMQEIQGGHSSSTTQNDLLLTFGLGSACNIDKVEVRWLDAANTVATFTGVEANYRIRLTEGQTGVQYLQ